MITTTSAELKRLNRALRARNSKLSDLLQASRDKLAELQNQIEALGQPPSTYGVYLERSSDGTSAEIFTNGRHMRVPVSPAISRADLVPGVEVRLGANLQILEVADFINTGLMGTVVEPLDAKRLIIADSTGEQRILKLAGSLTAPGAIEAKAGDTVLFDPRTAYAFEIIPKSDLSRLSLEDVPNVSYEDIGGLDSQIEQIRDAVELPFMHPDLYRTYDLLPPKGVLLYGPPGCGKTLIAKAVANSLAERAQDAGKSRSAYFLNIKGPELLNKYVGETERQIRLIFERARELADEGNPVIVFFDEMESIFRTRGSGKSSDMETTVVPQLLTELDGVEQMSNVIVIGATNREELIDPAILRPGRLDVKIRIDRPTREQARDIFKRYITEPIPMAVSRDELIDAGVEALFSPDPYVALSYSDGTENILHYSDFVSGAMIANIVSRAKKQAIKEYLQDSATNAQRKNPPGITVAHLVEAVRLERRESEDLPDTSNPDAWSRLSGKKGKRVIDIQVLDYAA
nr:proteasome ATPase [Corynebacterium caspium]